MIAPTEYQLAILTIVSEAVAISRDDLVVEAARLFGFDRTGPDLKEAIDRQSAILVKTGTIGARWGCSASGVTTSLEVASSGSTRGHSFKA
jgi:hypothetical protein